MAPDRDYKPAPTGDDAPTIRGGRRVGQNTSTAVMARRVEPPDSLDFFPTPPWATRALAEHVIDLHGTRVWEPACGEGHMARPLAEYAAGVFSSDARDYGGNAVHDFLFPYCPAGLGAVDWVVTNPPFRLAEQFVARGLEVANSGVALLVRTTFLEGVARYQDLFRPTPPEIIAQFAERVPMLKGRLEQDASTATAYCWIVWRRLQATRLLWIPPCRDRLERRGDYAPLTPESLPLFPEAK
jgi:hypothetical protein